MKQNILKSEKINKVFCVVGNKNKPLPWTSHSMKKYSIKEFLEFFIYYKNWNAAKKDGYRCIKFNLSVSK